MAFFFRVNACNLSSLREKLPFQFLLKMLFDAVTAGVWTIGRPPLRLLFPLKVKSPHLQPLFLSNNEQMPTDQLVDTLGKHLSTFLSLTPFNS